MTGICINPTNGNLNSFGFTTVMQTIRNCLTQYERIEVEPYANDDISRETSGSKEDNGKTFFRV